MKKNIIVPIFIASIMILSVLGYSLGSFEKTNKIKYKEKTFVQSEQGWTTYIGNEKLLLFNNPNDLSNITIPVTLQELNSANKIYLTLDIDKPDISNAYLLFQNILPVLKPQIVTACINDSAKCYDMPLKSCSDATSLNKVIQIQYSEQQLMTYKNNCLLIQGTQKDLIRQLEALILAYRL